jgi:hypothetical protein
MSRTVVQRELLHRFRAGSLLLCWPDGSQHWESPYGKVTVAGVEQRTLDAMLASGDLETEELGRVQPETGRLELALAYRLSAALSKKRRYETCLHCGRPLRAGATCIPCE